MPTREDLDALKKRINALGDEPRIRAERGESVPDVDVPESEMDENLGGMLAGEADGGGIDEMEALLHSYASISTDSDDENFDFDLDAPPTAPAEELDSLNAEHLEGDSSLLSNQELTDPLEAFLASDDAPEMPSDSSLEEPLPTPVEENPLDALDTLDALGGENEPPADFDSLSSIDNDEDPQSLVDDLSFLQSSQESSLEERGHALGDGDDVGESFGLDESNLDDLSRPDEASTLVEEDISSPSPEELDSPATQDDFGIEDLDFGSTDEFDDYSIPDDASLSDDVEALEEPETISEMGEEEPLQDLENLNDFGDIEELDISEDLGIEAVSLDEEPDDALTEMPDVGMALENLGTVEELDAEAESELSLDDDLDFGEELGADVLSDLRDAGDDESMQFSMDDFGDQYNFDEGSSGYTADLGVDLDEFEQALDEAEEENPFSLEEDEFEDLLEALSTLPRNLKLALEELLADEKRSSRDIEPILKGLLNGESPKSLAGRYKALTKRSISLPRSFQKRSGRRLEERHSTLAYRLAKDGWPVFRVVLLSMGIAWIVGAMLFLWVYRPIHAERLYRQGLMAVAQDDLDGALQSFEDAWYGWPLFLESHEGDRADRIADAPMVVRGWPVDKKWLEYARSLRRRKHWELATQFYEGYLVQKPEDKEARLEYISFLSRVLGEFERALVVAEQPAANGEWDRDYTLAAGDVYLEWAQDDPTQYENARYRYAKVLERSRNDERAILSMMRYHLRLDNEGEIQALLPAFSQELPGASSEPQLASEVFAALGEYHLRRSSLTEARRFLDLAQASGPFQAYPAFVDALYWKVLGDEESELSGYRRTLINLDDADVLGRNDLRMRILSLGGMGRIHASRSQRMEAGTVLRAQQRDLAATNYSRALTLYEDAQERGLLGASSEYGLLYIELGDIRFQGEDHQGELEFSLDAFIPLDEGRRSELRQAITHYGVAETLLNRGEVGSSLPTPVLFRRAYARSLLGEEGDLVDFYRVSRRLPEDREAQYALATTLLQREDFEAALVQYERVIRLLDQELAENGGVLMPLDRPRHWELLRRYIGAWNNLGVARARAAARSGEEGASALSAFATASDYLDRVPYEFGGLRDEDDRRLYSENADIGLNTLVDRETPPYVNRLLLIGLNTQEEELQDFVIYQDIPSSLMTGSS
ncbi:MAG: hypothetical protein MI717_02195 [Spirochaetales bacterium]|nr:hypothetical protein [Spirochaetales bacterium]